MARGHAEARRPPPASEQRLLRGTGEVKPPRREIEIRDLAGRFDAGIHLGEFIERDMVATRVPREIRAAIVGSPPATLSRTPSRHRRVT